MADNFDSGGRDFIGESDVHYQFRVAFVVCELCGDNGARAEAKKVLLWEEKVGICGGGGNYYGGGYDDDTADNIILLWYSVVNFGGGKFADFADFAICDGVSVSLWCDGGIAWGGNGGGVAGDKIIRFSHCGGGVFWWNEKFFGGNRAIPGVGVFDLSSDICAACNWTYWAENGKIKGRKLLKI